MYTPLTDMEKDCYQEIIDEVSKKLSEKIISTENNLLMIARLHQVQHAQGKLRREFVADMGQAGYSFSESQLGRWLARINAGEAAVSATKTTSALAHLTREQRDIAAGWLLSQNLIAWEFAFFQTKPLGVMW